MKRLYQAAMALRGVDTQTEVARLMGTSPQVVSNWEKRGISKEGLLTAQERIGCRAEWVKYGKGFMSSFGTEGQVVGGAPATGFDADSTDPVRISEKLRTHRLPMIRWEQVGQIGAVPVGNLDIVRFMDSPFQSSTGSFLLELVTEQMAPDYRPGEVIQVDPMADARHGDDVVVLLADGRPTFRRLIEAEGRRILQALNPHWPDRLLPYPLDARLIGVVVGSWMARRR